MKMQCNQPYCSGQAIERSRYCEKHKPIYQVRKDKGSYTPPKGWKSFSLNFRKENPLCQCGKPSQVCGHIIPHEQMVILFGEDYLSTIKRENLVQMYFKPLCNSCNLSQSWNDTRRINK